MRDQNIELVRIVSAFGIVLFHSKAPGASVGYAGLVAFIMLSTYFASGSTSKLAKRILIPWVFWSVFYLGWRYAADGNPFHPNMSMLQSLLYGTHLWFLPFIFVVNLVVARLDHDRLPLVCGVLAGTLLVATPWWRDLQSLFGPPATQYLHALPAALMGVAIRTRIGIALSLVGLAACAAWQTDGVSLPYGVGAAAVLGAMVLPKIKIDFTWLSSCMFGVYLVHIAALGVTNRLLEPRSFASALLAFMASCAGVWIARRFLPQAKSVLG